MAEVKSQFSSESDARLKVEKQIFDHARSKAYAIIAKGEAKHTFGLKCQYHAIYQFHQFPI